MLETRLKWRSKAPQILKFGKTVKSRVMWPTLHLFGSLIVPGVVVIGLLLSNDVEYLNHNHTARFASSVTSWTFFIASRELVASRVLENHR